MGENRMVLRLCNKRMERAHLRLCGLIFAKHRQFNSADVQGTGLSIGAVLI